MNDERESQVGAEGPLRRPEDVPASDGRSRTWLLLFFLVVVPGVLYATVLGVPFLPLGTGTKVWISAVLVVAAEGTFVISALVLGKEAVSRYRRALDPRGWFRKR